MRRFNVYLDPTRVGAKPAVLRLRAKNLRSSVRGGPVVADVDAEGPTVAQGALQNWLGQGVEIRNEYSSIVWHGLLNDVRYPADGDELGVSLDDLYNRIKVIYAYVDATGAQIYGDTDWAEDSASIAKYGIKELIYSGGQMEPAAALAQRATLLAQHAKPNKTLSLQGQYQSASLGCIGWWETLGWRIARRPEGRIEWEGNGDNYVQAIGWGIVGSNQIGFHLSAIHDMQARLGALTKDDRVVVSGAGQPGNNGVRTIVQGSREERVVYGPVNTISFDTRDDIEDRDGKGLGFIRADEFIFVTGSVDNNNGYHIVDSGGEDHIVTKATITGEIGVQPAGPPITIAQGHRATTVETVTNEEPGASVSLYLYGTFLYQTFTPTHNMNCAQVALKIGKVGTPVDSLQVALYVDSGAATPLTFVASTTLAGSLIGEGEDWMWMAMAAKPTLTAGVTYGLQVGRTGAVDPINYFTVELVRDTSYAGSCKAWTGSAWVGHTQLVTMPFRIWADEDTVTQIQRLLTDYGQFFVGADLVTATSGVRTNQYIDNDQTALEEIEKLLELGTSSGQRLLARVTPERVVRIYAEPLALEPMARLRSDRQIAHAGGGMRPAGQLPAGEWLTVRSQAAVALATGAIFVDEAEYNVDDGELSLDFKKVRR